MSTQSHRVVAPRNADRRRGPRLDVVERVGGYAKSVGVPVTLLNMSEGGFLMESGEPFEVGEIYGFRFTADRYAPVMLRARIVHSVSTQAADVASYVTGVEFVERGTRSSEQGIANLVRLLLGLRPKNSENARRGTDGTGARR